MSKGMMTTYGPKDLDDDPNLVKMPAGGIVIEPPTLEEGVGMGDLIQAEHNAKTGLVRAMNSARTYMKKLQQAQQDAGTWAAPRGVANPVSAIGGSHLSPNLADELEKVFTRYTKALRQGVETTLEGLNLPMS
jgi:hypothetical protein